jgi:UDP-N-acetylglucosamine acyltransferase
VQQRSRIGAHSFIGGMTGISRDVVPFVMATGRFARLAGINKVGLLRRGYDKETLHALHGAYKQFFMSEGSRAERLAAATAEFGSVPAVAAMLDFIRASGNRPLALPREGGVNSTDDDYDSDSEDA